MNYIRLNFNLFDDEFVIDNINCMLALQKNVYILKIHCVCKWMLYALFICLFYFKLASIIDSVQKKQYHCHETIRCRLSRISIVKLLKTCNTINLFFHIDVEILKFYENESNLCTSCHQYQKKIEFQIRHFMKLVMIYFENTMQKRRKISVFFQTMRWFESNQKLNAPFKTAHHENIHVQFCHVYFLKRLISTDSQKPRSHKRPRLKPQIDRLLMKIFEWLDYFISQVVGLFFCKPSQRGFFVNCHLINH